MAIASWGGRAACQSPEDRYEAYLWVDDAFALDDASLGRLRDLGITGINAEGKDAVARAGRSGMQFYVDHAVPKGLLHLHQKAFDEARTRWRLDPVPANLKRPVCFRDPQAVERALEDVRGTVAACAPFAPRFLSLTDEPSATRGINPIDWCRDDFCAAEFPKFLAERWGSKTLARDVWGQRWPADGPPVQVDTDEVRRALFHGIGTAATLVQWNDTRAFAEAGFHDALGRLSDEARRLRPGIKLALLGASMPSAFGGFDWEALGGRFDVIEPYDWGATRDIVRSSSPRADLFQTISPRGADPTAIRHQLWRGFLNGDRGVILFDATDWTGPASRPAGQASLEDIAPLLRHFQKPELAPWRRATPLRAQVAILHSMPSTRLHWLLDTRFDGATWFNRLSSFEVAESSEAINREAWTALLSDLGLSYRFITPRQLREGTLGEDGTLALVLPRAIAMADTEVAAVQAFAKGHLVMADCQLALFNSRLQLRERPALDEMFGISRPPIKGVDDVVTQDPESRSSAATVPAESRVRAEGSSAMQVVGTAPIFLVHGPRETRTLYLNTRIGSYLRNRLADPEAAERLRTMLRPLFIACGVRPRFSVAQLSPAPLWPFSVVVKKDKDDLLIGIELAATTGARPIDWRGAIAHVRPRIRVTFPGTYQTTDLLTGEDLGPLNGYELEVSATQPALLRLRP